jgi:phospholipid-binding lipoprotein MlaA
LRTLGRARHADEDFAEVFAVAGLMWAGVAVADDDQLAARAQKAPDAPKAEDPLEGVNRFTSEFNRVLRGAVIDPLVDGYQAVTPQFLQEAIGNAASNLNEPVTAISSFLQGDDENASNATKRFFINTTIGIGGINDKASEMGYRSREEDLGQAAGYHGTEPAAHIVLPILGPTNTRDLVGDVLTGLASPEPLLGRATQKSVIYSQNQDYINTLGKSALDPYIVDRNAYEQHRQFQINNGETMQVKSTDLDKADFR